MRLLLHEVFVDVGTGIAFVGVADDVFHRALGGTAARPFEMQRETCTAATTQAAVLQFGGESIPAAFGDEFLEGGVVGVNAVEVGGELGRLEM